MTASPALPAAPQRPSVLPSAPEDSDNATSAPLSVSREAAVVLKREELLRLRSCVLKSHVLLLLFLVSVIALQHPRKANTK